MFGMKLLIHSQTPTVQHRFDVLYHFHIDMLSNIDE